MFVYPECPFWLQRERSGATQRCEVSTFCAYFLKACPHFFIHFLWRIRAQPSHFFPFIFPSRPNNCFAPGAHVSSVATVPSARGDSVSGAAAPVERSSSKPLVPEQPSRPLVPEDSAKASTGRFESTGGGDSGGGASTRGQGEEAAARAQPTARPHGPQGDPRVDQGGEAGLPAGPSGHPWNLSRGTTFLQHGSSRQPQGLANFTVLNSVSVAALMSGDAQNPTPFWDLGVDGTGQIVQVFRCIYE